MVRRFFFLVLPLLFSLIPSVDGQKIVRGPYLQQGAASSMIVRWRTDVPTRSRLEYGTSADSFLRAVEKDGLFRKEHEVEISGLLPRTRYFYRIGASNEAGTNSDDSLSFVTPPVGGDEPFSVWVLGDAGTSGTRQTGETDAQRRVRDSFLARHPVGSFDFLMLLGDNAYREGTDLQYQRGFFAPYRQVLRSVVTWPTQGNHDVATNAYYHVFTLPKRGESGGVASGTERFYSFDHANAHFVSLNSELNDPSVRGAMLEWLKRDLAANKKNWTIAIWHHPPYSKGSHDSDSSGDSDGRLVWMREHVVPILDKHGVDMVLSGHSHSYERSRLLQGHYGPSATFSREHVVGGDEQNGALGEYEKSMSHDTTARGTVFVVAGTGGSVHPGPLNHPVMVVSKATLGSLYLTFDGNELTASMEDESGATFDQFTLRKDPARPRAVTQVSIAVDGSSCARSLTWGAVDGAVSYAIFRSPSAYQRGEEVWSGEGMHFSDSASLKAGTYYYSIRARGATGYGPWGEARKLVMPAEKCLVSASEPFQQP